MKYIQDFFKRFGFPQLVGLTALFVAAVAGFFSVAGIGMLFSGAAISAMVMATAIELGKLCSVAFLYRYWNKCTKVLRYYLTVATFVLMAITSAGVFGWLSSAYQSSHIQYELSQQRVLVLEEQKTDSEKNVEYAKQRVDSLVGLRTDQEKRLNETSTNQTLLRNPTQLRQIMQQNQELIASTEKDIRAANTALDQARADVIKISKEIGDMKAGNASGTKDIQTFSFVAEAIGTDLNTVAKWFIVSIILVFDPLAVALVLAYNVSVFGGVGRGTVSNENVAPKVEEKVAEPIIPEPEPKPVSEIPVKKEVAEKPAEDWDGVLKKLETKVEPPKKKFFSEMSDADKRAMSYDDIQRAQEEERRAKMPEIYKRTDGM
jgi:hypothetical protein